MAKFVQTLDTVFDAVPSFHNIFLIISCLKVGGTMCLLGAIPKPYEISSFMLLFSRYHICGLLINGTEETKEILEFCADNDVLPKIEIIPARKAVSVYEAMTDGTIPAIRYVIDMSTIGELY